jgi:hypothetical protein
VSSRPESHNGPGHLPGVVVRLVQEEKEWALLKSVFGSGISVWVNEGRDEVGAPEWVSLGFEVDVRRGGCNQAGSEGAHIGPGGRRMGGFARRAGKP